MKAPSFSYSSLSQFITCPKQYSAHKVEKYVPHTDTEATIYGRDLHLAAEHYIGSGTPLPEKYNYIKGYLDTLNNIKGDKFCELELGIKLEGGEYSLCDFEAKDRYWRGIADLVIVDEAAGKAYIVDYKTGKSAKYADTKQLDLVAAGLFAKFPKIMKVKSALIFTVSKEFVQATHYREMMPKYLEQPAKDVARIEAALENGVWNPISGPLCKFCAIKQCEYNRS